MSKWGFIVTPWEGYWISLFPTSTSPITPPTRGRKVPPSNCYQMVGDGRKYKHSLFQDTLIPWTIVQHPPKSQFSGRRLSTIYAAIERSRHRCCDDLVLSVVVYTLYACNLVQYYSWCLLSFISIVMCRLSKWLGWMPLNKIFKRDQHHLVAVDESFAMIWCVSLYTLPGDETSIELQLVGAIMQEIKGHRTLRYNSTVNLFNNFNALCVYHFRTEYTSL